MHIARMHTLLHCEYQIASYHNNVIIPQYQLEKLYRFLDCQLIPLNTNAWC